MRLVERLMAAHRLFNERRQSVGWRGSLNLRSLDKEYARNPSLSARPISINPNGSRYRLMMRTGPSSDIYVARQVFGEKGYAVMAGLSNVTKIVDCGANAGYTSAFLLTSYPKASVLAVEPDEANWRLCVSNLLPWGARATVIQAGVWGSETRLVVSSGKCENEWGLMVKEAGAAEDDATVPAVTMHELIERAGGKVDILKIDIEWAELNVFAGDTSWLSAVRNLAIELHDEECRRVFFQAMEPWAYELRFDNELTICLNICARKP